MNCVHGRDAELYQLLHGMSSCVSEQLVDRLLCQVYFCLISLPDGKIRHIVMIMLELVDLPLWHRK